MPIYEYSCKKCGHQFEELVQSSADPIACPQCTESNVEKMFSTFGVGVVGDSLPCASGACHLPEPGPSCCQGTCPGRMN